MMKTFVLIILLSFILPAVSLTAQEQSIPYTQADRDRLVRVETRIQELDKSLNKRIDDLDKNLNKRIDDLQSQIIRLQDKFDSYFMWGFGLVLMSIFGLFGFIIYDRRTTLAPVENKTEKIIKTLKEAAESNPSLQEAAKKTSLW